MTTTPTTRTRRSRIESASGAPRIAEPARPTLGPPHATRNGVELHLITYVVGNLLFWTLWGAISISTDHWYWWPIVPFAGWTAVLALHLWLAHRSASR